jgi:hypothetical protein
MTLILSPVTELISNLLYTVLRSGFYELKNLLIVEKFLGKSLLLTEPFIWVSFDKNSSFVFSNSGTWLILAKFEVSILSPISLLLWLSSVCSVVGSIFLRSGV